jgi:hypothetical protein
MTREEYIEGIKLRLQQLNDKTYSYQYIEHMINLAWQKMIFVISGKVTTDEAYYAKLFQAVTVAQDSSGLYYHQFTEPLIHLDRIGSGVISVNQINAHEFDFVPSSEKMFSLLPSQEMYEISNKIYYKVDYDRILFCDKMPETIATAGVDIRMIVPFSSYDYTDHIPLPAGQVDGFFDAVVTRMIGTPPADLSNKNSDVEWNRNIPTQ